MFTLYSVIILNLKDYQKTAWNNSSTIFEMVAVVFLADRAFFLQVQVQAYL